IGWRWWRRRAGDLGRVIATALATEGDALLLKARKTCDSGGGTWLDVCVPKEHSLRRSLGDRLHHATVHLQRDPGDVGGGGGEKEGRRPTQLLRFAVAPQRNTLAYIPALLFDRYAEGLGARLVERA